MPSDSNQWPIPPPSGPTADFELDREDKDTRSLYAKPRANMTLSQYLEHLGAESVLDAVEIMRRRRKLLEQTSL